MSTTASHIGVPNRMLLFRVAQQPFAVRIDLVREIVAHQGVTRVPRTPPHILGVISLRGGLVPIVDLCQRLDVGNNAACDTSAILILEVGPTRTGFLVDMVEEVIAPDDDQLSAAPDMGLQVDLAFIESFCRTDSGEIVPILDLRALFDQHELRELEQIDAQQDPDPEQTEPVRSDDQSI